MPVHLTILNNIAGPDLEIQLKQHAACNLKHLDLKERIFGKSITQLSAEEAQRAQALVAAYGMRVQCFSTTLFADSVDQGPESFRAKHLEPLDRTLAAARILKPAFIRLIDAKVPSKPAELDGLGYVRARHPWLLELYREAIQRISDAGFTTTIENEPGGFFDAADTIAHTFETLGLGARVCYTWDVQNLWESGVAPSLAVLERVKPWLRYYHVKGGRIEGGRMIATTLADAAWPVVEITQRVVDEGLSPVICLNPPHGVKDPRFPLENLAQRDLAFLREHVKGIV
ncbi:MAG: hypothetical protein AMXMBFR7_06730 [Planctomycetota bacterium]